MRHRWLLGVVLVSCLDASDDRTLPAPPTPFERKPPGQGFRDGGAEPPIQPQKPPPMPAPDFGATVTLAEAPPPIFGGTLLVTADDRYAIAADPDRDLVFVIDLSTNALHATIALPAHALPFRSTEDSSGHVHVSLRGTGEVATIDPDAGTLVRTSAACAEPRGVVFDPATHRVHVACERGAIVSLDAATGNVVGSVQTAHKHLRDIFVAGTGFIVSDFRDAALLSVASDGTVTKVQGMSALGSTQPDFAWRTIAMPTGGFLVAHQMASTTAARIESGGYAAGCGSVVASAMTHVDDAGKVEPWPLIPGAVLPVDVATSPSGGELLMAMPGNARIAELPQFAFFKPRQSPSIPCGKGGGGGIVPDMPLDVQALERDEFVAVAFTHAGRALLQSRQPAKLVVLGAEPAHAMVAAITLSDQSRMDTGHAIFHSNAGSNLACASCHAEGGEDGRIWKLTTGTDFKMRRTPSLRGTLKGTAPYHWDGEEPNLDALVEDVYRTRMSGPELDFEQKVALTVWLGALPAPHTDATVDHATRARGAALFAGKGECNACHVGPQQVVHGSVDVGTGGSFQVPPLAGLGLRAPYMHDGCAGTLDDRLTNTQCGGGAKHGRAGDLTSAELLDLRTYLDAL